MRILQLTPRLPYPPDEGGRIGIFNLTKYLSFREHKITLLSVTANQVENIQVDIQKLRKWCDVKVVYKNTKTKLWGLLLNLFFRIPYTISKYHSRKVKDAIREILSREKFDIVHIDSLHMAYYSRFINREFNLPIVLREHNVETTIMERFYKNQKSLFIKFYAYLQWKKLRRYEAKTCEVFDKCFMTTKEDEERIRKMNPGVKSCIIPVGVDLSYFYPSKIKEEPFSLIFVGSMKWLPNIDGVLWFHSEVLPRIKEIFSEVKFYIVGHEPPMEVKELEKRDKNIIVTGFVEDVRPYVAKSSLYVVPLRIGGGMRLKILEAMAMEKPVVSTLIGVEGVEAANGKDIIIAANAENFAERIIKLLKNKDYRKIIGKNGRKLVEEKYKWESILEKLEEKYVEVVRRRKERCKP